MSQRQVSQKLSNIISHLEQIRLNPENIDLLPLQAKNKLIANIILKQILPHVVYNTKTFKIDTINNPKQVLQIIKTSVALAHKDYEQKLLKKKIMNLMDLTRSSRKKKLQQDRKILMQEYKELLRYFPLEPQERQQLRLAPQQKPKQQHIITQTLQF